MIDTTNMTTRPFDMKLARIGAPYITRSGKKATILKWDCNHDQFPLAGVFGERDEPKRWRADGGFGHSHGTFAEDLVMAPLGLVQGRPFFSGDTIVGTNGSTFMAEPRDVDGDHASWRWPPRKFVDKQAMAIGLVVFEAMRGVVEIPSGASAFVFDFKPKTRAEIEVMIAQAIAGVDQ